MRRGTQGIFRHPVYLLSILILLPTAAYAQEIVPTERIEDWFYSRLVWAAVIAGVVGVLVGAIHLSRLKAHAGEFHVNSHARRSFFIWLIGLLVLGGILLLVDAWTLFPFGTASLSFVEALSQVWLNYRTLLILLAAAAAFYVLVALTTRFSPGSRCPYAFLPGPKVK